ncbi:MAG TPA: beta-galactosidase [Devosiaceae bacterium]
MRPTLGVCYYPEHWPEDRWQLDAAMMSQAGISYVRVGEFAWSRLEPNPGQMHFDWLERAMDVLGEHGLKVILGTPTATPPRWMLDKYPDMLALDVEGRPRGFGSRRHYCFSHQGYLEESRRITRILAERFAGHPALGGWQTDNEFGCHLTVVSYSRAALAEFRNWLRRRYGSIERLNQAWGNVFWSMEYSHFDQIGLPNLTVTEANPAHSLDFRRFSSDQVVRFNRAQVEILKSARPDLPVIHNFMGRFTEFDHFDVGADLDVAGWDSYPLGFLDQSDNPSGHKLAYLRQGDPDFQAMHHDIYRSVCGGRWWVMEQQPGPVNWAPHNPDPLAGMVRLWSWEAFAHGAEVVSYFRWRQFHSAQEQMHAGLLRPDGAPAPALDEATQVASELRKVGISETCARARAAIVFDYESEWAWQIQPHAKGFSHSAQVRAAYVALRKRGVDIDILPKHAKSFEGYDLVVIPALFAWNDNLLAALRSFKGQVLVGPRSGSKTGDFTIPDSLAPGLPPELLDARVLRVDSSDAGLRVPVEGGGTVGHWRERLEASCDVLMTDDEGEAVLIVQGNLHYLGSTGDAAFMQRVLDGLLERAGIAALDLPEGVRARSRDGCRIYVNYSARPATIALAADESGYVLGGPELPPAGVTVARLSMGG